MDGGVSALILFLTIVTVLAIGIMAAYGLVLAIFAVLRNQTVTAGSSSTVSIMLPPPQSHAIGD